jgi:hypothetical protein
VTRHLAVLIGFLLLILPALTVAQTSPIDVSLTATWDQPVSGGPATDYRMVCSGPQGTVVDEITPETNLFSQFESQEGAHLCSLTARGPGGVSDPVEMAFDISADERPGEPVNFIITVSCDWLDGEVTCEVV